MVIFWIRLSKPRLIYNDETSLSLTTSRRHTNLRSRVPPRCKLSQQNSGAGGDGFPHSEEKG